MSMENAEARLDTIRNMKSAEVEHAATDILDADDEDPVYTPPPVIGMVQYENIRF